VRPSLKKKPKTKTKLFYEETPKSGYFIGEFSQTFKEQTIPILHKLHYDAAKRMHSSASA
jgi:hypothetical protein